MYGNFFLLTDDSVPVPSLILELLILATSASYSQVHDPSAVYLMWSPRYEADLFADFFYWTYELSVHIILHIS